MKFKHILVPIDFSEYADMALDYALFLAQKYDARITLMHSIILFTGDIDDQTLLQRYEDETRAREEETFRLLKPHMANARQKGVALDSRIVRGFSAAESIMEVIEEGEFDLVLMATHGRTGFKKLMYGSVTEKVVRLSPIPVLTTHQTLRKFAIEKILVPVDFSEYSRSAAKTAIAMAEDFNAKIVFIHTVEEEFHPAFYAGHVASVFTVDKDLKDRTVERMKAFIKYEHPQACYVVTEGRSYNEIAHYADHMGADLVVIATRGLSAIKQWLVGSTTERVVRLANCPVLIIERGESIVDNGPKLSAG